MTPEDIQLAREIFTSPRWVDLPSYRTYPYWEPATQKVHQRYEMAAARRGDLVPMLFEEGLQNPWTEVLLVTWFREAEKQRLNVGLKFHSGEAPGFQWEICDTARYLELLHPSKEWNRGFVHSLLELWQANP